MYSRFIVDNNNREVWSLKGRFSEEFISGAYHAFNIGRGFLPRGKLTDNYGVMVQEEDGYIINPFREFDKSHVVATDDPRLGNIIEPKQLQDICENTTVKDDGYYIWMWGPRRISANLMMFQTPDFMQGLFTILNAFHAPYDKVLMHCPLKITTHDNNRYAQYYVIEGYPLPFLPIEGHELVYDARPADSYKFCNAALNQM